MAAPGCIGRAARVAAAWAACALLLSACGSGDGSSAQVPAPSTGGSPPPATGGTPPATTGSASVSLGASAYSAVAAAGSLPIVVQLVRTGTGTGEVSVHYATADGTARGGTDYQSTSGTLTWAAGDSSDRQVTVSLLGTAGAGRSFTLSLSAASGATLGAATQATVTLAAAGRGLALVSRGVPAYASSGTASYANDASYDHVWRSKGVPATIAYDLSSVAPAPTALLVAWYNDTTYGYDHVLVGQAGYNNAGDYVLEANAAAGGGTPPASGWVALATVAGNTLHSREHLVAFAGYHWLRLRATASDGSSGNSDIALKMDAYDASGGVGDGWLFGGDSITANCMGHKSEGGGAYDSFGNELLALRGVVPPQENAGMPSWDALRYGAQLPGWLALFPGRYVTLALGTNDAAGGVAPATYEARMEAMVQAVIAAGKVPVLPTIPWSPEPTHAANIPGLNARIAALVARYPQAIAGPDLYAFFQAYPNLVSADQVHPTAAGCAALRSQWAQFAAAQVY